MEEEGAETEHLAAKLLTVASMVEESLSLITLAESTKALRESRLLATSSVTTFAQVPGRSLTTAERELMALEFKSNCLETGSSSSEGIDE